MQKNVKKRSRKAGLPPGSLVHIGEIYRENAHVTVFNYDEDTVRERVVHTVDECVALREQSAVTWINVDGIHEADFFERLGEKFGLHSLVLEDVLNTAQRPKLEEYDNYLYVVLKMLYFNREKDALLSEQVSLILGKDYVLSFQEGDENHADVFEPVRERLRLGAGKLRKHGPDFLMYTLMDAIVDNYFIILENLDTRIEEADNALTPEAREDTLQTIRELKRETLFLHKTIWPLREVTGSLYRNEMVQIQDSTRLYLRDVNDHIVQLMDAVETLRDILAGMLDIYLSAMSNRLNEVMKVLTVISTVFIPLTFIAGVYGMNFKYMPELNSPLGYPVVLLIMAAIAFLMLRYFKRKKWF